jgi:hypothetical protein
MRNRQVRWFDKNNVEDDVSRYEVRLTHSTSFKTTVERCPGVGAQNK